jgi:peptidoglycan biosynthesis protein MviN/MurJ (putative lipid II flippase)
MRPATKVRRFVLRLVARLAITLAALWYALHLMGSPIDSFPYALKRQLEWALLFLVACGAILTLLEIVRSVASRAHD